MKASKRLHTATMALAALALTSSGVSFGRAPTPHGPSVATRSLARRNAANAAISRESVASKSLARRAVASSAAAKTTVANKSLARRAAANSAAAKRNTEVRSRVRAGSTFPPAVAGRGR